MPGPLPKRSDERVRRNKTGEDGLAVDQYDLEGEVLVPWAVYEHMFVQGLWESLQTSVTKEFYEPSDWQYARITLYLLDKTLMDGKTPSAMMLSALDSMMTKMMLTEADRRRMKIEAKRGKKEDADVVNAADMFAKRFAEQRKTS